MATLQSTNPYNWELNATYETISDEEITTKIETAHQAYLSWKDTSFAERKDLCYKLAAVMRAEQAELGEMQTKEMWMLYSSSYSGIESTASLIEWMADNAERVLGEKSYDKEGTSGVEFYTPLGIIYWVGPWNFPFNQVLRAAVPNILAGNTTVYKHSSDVPMCAEKIEELFLKAGFPVGVYQNLFIKSSQSEHIISHEYIAGVNLTGWERAGSAVGSLAGKYIKPSILELGGNDAWILLSHEDTEKYAKIAASCRITNGGQRCNGSKRFIVLKEHYDEFAQHFAAALADITIGDPMDENTDLGPMATAGGIEDLERQVAETLDQGARLVTGGKTAGDRNQFFEPTLFVDVTEDMTIWKEETFGPICGVMKAKNAQEAIKMANRSDFWLSASVWWDDDSELREVSKKLDGGMIFINKMAGSKKHLPFGGVGKSGYGKENGEEGLRAFANKKVILY